MSPRAACRLVELGFTDVYDYAAGKADWTAAGLPTQGYDGRRTLPPFITTQVVTAAPDELVGDALARASTAGADVILVVNPDRVVLGRIRPSKTAPDTSQRVEAFMEEGPATVRADENPHDLLARMRNRNVPEVVVTDPEGHLIGLIRRTDLEATDAP